MTAILTTVIFGMVAFAIDIGYIVHARTELQRTADACALGAARRLPDKTAALTCAQQIAQENKASVGPDLNSADVVFGYWDRDTATFYDPPPSGRSVNAVRVTVRRTEASGSPLRLFFAPVLGDSLADVSASATAWYDRGVCGPFIGVDWLEVPGNSQTDSYSTFDGFYNPNTAGERGSICSNGPITVDGGPIIRGDARAGKGYQVAQGDNAVITGSVGSRLTPLHMPPVDLGDAKLKNDNASAPLIPKGNSWQSPVDAEGNFLLDGNTVYNLPPGTYCFNNFTLEGQSVLNIGGETTIYVTGDFRRAGGTQVNNNTQIPNNLKILMTGGTAEITSGNPFHGVIYAPNTPIVLDGSSGFFGACVGKTLIVTGTPFGHYDEELDMEHLDIPRRTMLVD